MTRIDRIRWMVVAVILGRFCSINSISIQGDSWEVSDWERLDQSIVGPNDYTGFRVSHLCLDSDCEHLELNVTGRHERGADLFMFQMVRSRLFDSNLTHQYPELNLHCYYQHYNPLMGLNGYFRNGLRFSQKIAYAIICPNEKAFLGESRIMFNLPRSWQPKVQNEFVADVQLLLYRESNEWRSTYHEYSNRDICASSPSNRTTRPPNALEEMITKLQDKHLGRNTRFVKPSKQVWDVLRQNGAYLRDEESYNNVPYVKLFLYFEQVNNPIYNRDTLSDAFHTLYLTDLVLRRLPVRIVVVDILFVAKFTTKTCFGFKELKTMDEQVLQVGSQLKDANFVVIQANYESNCIHWMNQALHLYPIGSRVNLVFTRTNWRHIICDTFEMLNRIHLYLFRTFAIFVIS